jgi:hypothetical protein
MVIESFGSTDMVEQRLGGTAAAVGLCRNFSDGTLPHLLFESMDDRQRMTAFASWVDLLIVGMDAFCYHRQAPWAVKVSSCRFTSALRDPEVGTISQPT